jgi:hypothetical protein
MQIYKETIAKMVEFNDSIRKQHRMDTLYFEKDKGNTVTHGLPRSIANHKIVVLNRKVLIKMLKKNKKGIILHRVSYPYWKDEKNFIINITPSGANIKKINNKDEPYFVIGGGWIFYYKYDEEKCHFVLDKYEEWGV